LGIMHIAFRLYRPGTLRISKAITCHELLHACADTLMPLLFSENAPEQFAVCWALAWIGELRIWTPPISPNVLDRLFTLWLGSSNTEVRRMAQWAFTSLPLLPRETKPLSASSEVEKFTAVAKGYSQRKDFREKCSVLVAAYYLRSPWSDTALARLVKEEIDRRPALLSQRTLRDLMAALHGEDTTTLPRRRKSGKRRQRR
jgi:hypothetical protein